MAPKSTAQSTQVKKETSKKAKDSSAPEKKSAHKGGDDLEEIQASSEAAPGIDPDELEEQEDAASEAASGGGGNAAALAAASGSSEMSASFKNFRHHPDMENFYRFIYENDLRHEALAIIDDIMVMKAQKKAGKATKAPGH